MNWGAAPSEEPRINAASFLLVAVVFLAGCASAAPLASLAQGTSGRVAFQSLTFPGTLWDPFMSPPTAGKPVAVAGTLTLPLGPGRVPGAILTHGCGGLAPLQGAWAARLNEMGFAAFVIDSFSGRNVTEICTGRSDINTASVLVDVYRARDLLATHPRVDPSRIVLMGFSFGGRTAVWAAHTRFQERYGARPFAAYLAFYPVSCYITLAEETRVGDAPIRIFHGVADDWTPIAPCRQYVERMRRAGKDVALFEYPDAYHGFDASILPSSRSWPDALSPRNCTFVEREGKIVDPTTGRVAGLDAPCFSRGIHIGYHPQAHGQAIRDVQTFLTAVFNLK